MSDDPLRTLQFLEAEYAGQPLIAQQADLRAINQLRAQLGMPQVDARLKAIDAPAVEAKPEPKPAPKPDHAEARAVYRDYLKRVEELKPHQAYADRVARATGGPGQTPVRPLATMGTGGGPLLCDHCGKPIILEGGQFQGVYADAAWAQNPVDNWRSWISGGMVVEIVTNGTLRIYHGYPGRNVRHCCNIASRNAEKAQEKFTSAKTPEMNRALLTFIEDEFPDLKEKARFDLLNEILNTVYEYDPGIGVNRPDTAS